jgi:hypothetical protein
MKKTILFFCIASLTIISCQPEPSLAQAQGAARAGVRKLFNQLIERKAEKKAADFIDGKISIPNRRIKKLAPHEELVRLDLERWKFNCKHSARNQVLLWAGRSIISQEDLNQLAEQAVNSTINSCLRGPQTLKSRIRELTSDLVREILSEQHNFQLTSFNRQDS